MEGQLWARFAVGGDAALSEQEEGRGQASRLAPHNGRNRCCDLCFSWLKVTVDPEGGVRPASKFYSFFFFSVGQVGGQTLLGSDLFPSEEPWLVLLQCSNVSGGVGGKREEEEPQSHSIYAFYSLVMD